MNQENYSYIVYMIHACANAWGVSPSEAYGEIKKSGCLDQYLIPYYDVLHTQGTDYVVNDIEEYIRNGEVTA